MNRSLLVIGAGAPWEGTRLADRHIAEALTDRFEVLYVDPPRSFRDAHNDERLSTRPGSVERIDAGMWRLTPRVTPRHWYPGLRQLNARLIERSMRRAADAIGLRVGGVLSTRDVLLGVLGGVQAFWARDDYAAGAGLMGLSNAAVLGMQERALSRSQMAIAVTPALCDKWENLGLPTRLVPNGVDPDRFGSPAPRPVDVPAVSPLVGFAGTVSTRIDLDLMLAVADSELDLLVVGPPQRTMPHDSIARLADHPRVHWVGHRPYEELPAYVQAMDVGLVPYTDSRFNRASFPLKTLEYLAAGVPVVATDLPAIDQLDTDLVTTRGPESFVEAVRDQISNRHDSLLTERRRALARSHSWSQRADDIVAAMGIG